MQNDPDVVEQMMAKEAEDYEREQKEGSRPEPWRPNPDDWTLLHELTAQNRDILVELATITADLPTGVKTRTKPPPAYPRPETLLDRRRREVAAERDRAADQRLLDLGDSAKRRWREQQAATQPAAG